MRERLRLIDTERFCVVKDRVLILSKHMWPQSFQATEYALVIFALWQLALTLWIIKKVKHYQKLTRGASGQNLETLIEKALVTQEQDKKQVENIRDEINRLKNESKNYFQKQAFIRFNPFEDTGGDQSFVIALLDGQNNGFVISSLHSRGATRVYAKAVTDGKSNAHHFSKEEKEVVERAARQEKSSLT